VSIPVGLLELSVIDNRSVEAALRLEMDLSRRVAQDGQFQRAGLVTLG